VIPMAESGVSLVLVAAGSADANVRKFIDTWIPLCLEILEGTAIVLFAFFCVWRLAQFGFETGWSFHGVLPLLHENWRGGLFLMAVLFYRAIPLALSRVRRVNVLGVEAEILPVGQPTILDAPPRAKKAGRKQ